MDLDILLDQADAVWMLPLLLVMLIADGVFSPLPTEMLLLGLGALREPFVTWQWWALFATAVLGAALGDCLSYGLGRLAGHRGPGRWPRLWAWVDRAGAGLHHRPAMVLLSARFVPGWRIVANLAAGASRLELRRFTPVVLLTATAWASWMLLVAGVVGAWTSNPLVGMVLAAVVAAILGRVIDQVVRRRRGSRTVAAGH